MSDNEDDGVFESRWENYIDSSGEPFQELKATLAELNEQDAADSQQQQSLQLQSQGESQEQDQQQQEESSSSVGGGGAGAGGEGVIVASSSASMLMSVAPEAASMKSNAKKCPGCGRGPEKMTKENGQLVCAACGAIVEDVAMVSEVNFMETGGGGRKAVGKFVSAVGAASGSSMSRTQTLERARNRIEQMASLLALPQAVAECAHRLYFLCLQSGFTRGRKAVNIAAACIYVVCRRENKPYMLLDIADALDTSVYSIGHCFLQMTAELELNIPVIDPSLYIHRFASQLEFEDKTQAVANAALRIIQRICGAALLISARLFGFKRTPEEVLQVVRISDATLMKRLNEFTKTPAADLSFQQLLSNCPVEEGLPPAYTSGLKRDLKKQEQEEEVLRIKALRKNAFSSHNSDTETEEEDSNPIIVKCEVPSSDEALIATSKCTKSDDTSTEIKKKPTGRKKRKGKKTGKSHRKSKKDPSEKETKTKRTKRKKSRKIKNEVKGEPSGSDEKELQDSTESACEPNQKKRRRAPPRNALSRLNIIKEEFDWTHVDTDEVEREMRIALDNNSFLSAHSAVKHLLEHNGRPCDQTCSHCTSQIMPFKFSPSQSPGVPEISSLKSPDQNCETQNTEGTETCTTSTSATQNTGLLSQRSDSGLLSQTQDPEAHLSLGDDVLLAQSQALSDTAEFVPPVSTTSATTPLFASQQEETEETSGLVAKLDPEETFSDLEDSDIDQYIITNSEELELKERAWNEMNHDYLIEMASLPEGNTTKRIKKPRKSTPFNADSAADALASALERKGLSSKINYSVLHSLLPQQHLTSESATDTATDTAAAALPDSGTPAEAPASEESNKATLEEVEDDFSWDVANQLQERDKTASQWL
ncbi:brf1 subunit of RNA polymerase iii transcription initiation factor iiib [Pelomyxa schiedti]|nr:brf1 subunit of RNA polymerase iii transcription initiation factor iiib [Pelomyxa schiedti]